MTDAGQSKSSHLRGSVLLFAGRLFALVANFVVQVVTIRFLSKSDYGVFAFALSLTNIFSVVCLLGLDKSISRVLSVYVDRQEKEKFWGAVLVSIGTVLLCSGIGSLLCVVIYFLDMPLGRMDTSSLGVLALLSGLIVAESINALFVSFFASLSEAKSILVRRHFLGPLFKLSAALIVVGLSGSVFHFALGQLLAGVLASAICFPMLFKVIRKRSELRWPGFGKLQFPVRKILGSGTGFLVGDIGFLLRGALVPLIIGLYFNSEAVAAYQSVFSIARLNEIVLVTFSILYLPKAATLASRSDTQSIQNLFESTAIWVTFLSFPLFAITFLSGNAIPSILFGAEYHSSGQLLKWLAVAFFVNATFGISLRTLRAIGKVRWVLVCDVFVIVTSLASVFLLVPYFGAEGATWSVLSSYLIQSIVYQVVVAKTTQISPLSVRVYVGFSVGVLIVVLLDQLRLQLGQPPWVGLGLSGVAIAVFFFCFFKWLSVNESFPELQRFLFFRRQPNSA